MFGSCTAKWKIFSLIYDLHKNNKEIAMAAVQQDGQIYHYVPQDLQDDLDIIMVTALKIKKDYFRFSKQC